MSALSTDIRILAAELYFLPIETRMPLKFGDQVLTKVVCARVKVAVEDAQGRTATGWGETPLSVAWVWPSTRTWTEREEAMKTLCARIAKALPDTEWGHPMEHGVRFIEHALHTLRAEVSPEPVDPLPELAALVCFSAFDLAVFDAFGNLHGVPVFETLGADWLKPDLAHFFGDSKFAGKYPADYLQPRQTKLPVWHLVGGLDPLSPQDLNGTEPQDGHPVLLRDWIRTDGLKCLKIKLRGTDSAWDYDRLVQIGRISIEEGVEWLTADFNCTVTDPAYVCDVLDRLAAAEPQIYSMLLYIEQPFPYDLAAHRIDVRSVSARKPLYLDESAHDWRYVRMGLELGWTGVALKTCKTLTGALLSLCWAREHGMGLMVQDLTNPMLAQIPHVSLAAHAGTIMGVESNGMQFYPEASAPERVVHPGIYQRRGGVLNLETLGSTGFGYRVEEIKRKLPERISV